MLYELIVHCCTCATMCCNCSHKIRKTTCFRTMKLNGGSKGGSAGIPHHHQGYPFFNFDIQIFQNVGTSEVSVLLMRLAPATGNPGSATETFVVKGA